MYEMIAGKQTHSRRDTSKKMELEKSVLVLIRQEMQRLQHKQNRYHFLSLFTSPMERSSTQRNGIEQGRRCMI